MLPTIFLSFLLQALSAFLSHTNSFTLPHQTGSQKKENIFFKTDLRLEVVHLAIELDFGLDAVLEQLVELAQVLAEVAEHRAQFVNAVGLHAAQKVLHLVAPLGRFRVERVEGVRHILLPGKNQSEQFG